MAAREPQDGSTSTGDAESSAKAEGTPRSRMRIRIRIRIPGLDRVPRPSRTVLISGVAALLIVAANVAMVLTVSHWQRQEETLLQANEQRGSETSAAEAASEEQTALLALLEQQLAAAQERLTEIDEVQEDRFVVLDTVRAGIADLRRCTKAQDDLIDYLWTTKTSLHGGDRVDAVDAQCSRAKSAFNNVKIHD